jgi:hypothetical protein
MTALEIVKNIYPVMPPEILLRFESLLPAEASAYNSEYASNDHMYALRYNEIMKKNSQKQIVFWHGLVPMLYDKIDLLLYENGLDRTVSILNPSNLTHKIQSDIVCTFYVRWGVPEFKSVNAIARFIYDRRVFTFDTIKLVSNEYNNNGFLGWGTTSKWLATFQYERFQGIESIVILYENGIRFDDVNYDDVYLFKTYLTAYKKFSTEILAEKSLLEKHAANNVNNYKQQLDDQANRELADLQSKKLQLLIAIDNEAKSAQRDFQNMLLTAQSLKTQLGASIAQN